LGTLLSNLQAQFTFISTAISLLFHVLCTTNRVICRILGCTAFLSIEIIRVLCQ